MVSDRAADRSPGGANAPRCPARQRCSTIRRAPQASICRDRPARSQPGWPVARGRGGQGTDERLGEAAAIAAQALEKAKVAADIKFNRNTALLSQEDIQIATQLKGLYPDVATAPSSVETQGISVNNAFKGLSASIETTLSNDLTDRLQGGRRCLRRHGKPHHPRDRADDHQDHDRRASLQSAFSGGFSLSGFGFNPIAGATGSAHGNVFASGEAKGVFKSAGVIRATKANGLFRPPLWPFAPI
jgi:hypothetical protein